MKVIEIGCVPPPFGGVAVHLQRLLEHLKQRGIPHQLFDISGNTKKAENVICTKWWKVAIRLLGFSRAVVHFHNFSPRNLVFYWLLGLKHITMLSMHNERFVDELDQITAPVRRILVKILNRLDMIFVPNDKCSLLLARLVEDPNKIIICPEFIAPTLPDRPLVPEQIAELRRRHQYLISSNAFQISFFQGEDLYGIDLLVDLTADLVHNEELDVALVFLLPKTGDPAYFAEQSARIRKLQITESFIFVTEPVDEACAIWQISDVVIRATNTDGDSLTVKEALWCGTPVIASDCAPRDPAVVLFKTRDLADLKAKAVAVLSDLETSKASVKNVSFENGVESIIETYERFTRGR